MSLLSDIKTIMTTLKIPCEVGVFKTTPAPSTYAVIVPTNTSIEYADNYPQNEIQSVRIIVYTKGSYTTLVKSICTALANADICIEEQRYIAHDDTTGLYQYAIDVENNYDF